MGTHNKDAVDVGDTETKSLSASLKLLMTLLHAVGTCHTLSSLHNNSTYPTDDTLARSRQVIRVNKKTVNSSCKDSRRKDNPDATPHTVF